MFYNECKHYEGGYCQKAVNSFGINEACCERNDCPYLLMQVKAVDWNALKKISKEEEKKNSKYKPKRRQ